MLSVVRETLKSMLSLLLYCTDDVMDAVTGSLNVEHNSLLCSCVGEKIFGDNSIETETESLVRQGVTVDKSSANDENVEIWVVDAAEI